MNNSNKYASVSVKDIPAPVAVPITSNNKPEISVKLCDKWQEIINVMAGCLCVPAGLIMKLDSDKISVFISSSNKENPYSKGEFERLKHGLYCETVVGTNDRLLVPNAMKDSYWRKNPDIKLGMISYLGYPIKWPDGEIFGTICVLDSKENAYSQKYIDLLNILKNSVENDLACALNNYYELKIAYNNVKKSLKFVKNAKSELEKSLVEKDLLLQEIHHRVKNNLQIVSSLIDLQHTASTDQTVSGELKTIRNRIYSMGIVHEILYNSRNFKCVNISEYIQRLIANLKISLSSEWGDHKYDMRINNKLNVNLDTAIPMGLLANEIITNSIKHAFPNGEDGEISIAIEEKSPGCYNMVLSDNGRGMAKNPKTANTDNRGLGGQIISLLVEQLNGEMKIINDNGLTYEIILRKNTKEDKRWLKKS